MGGKRSSGLIGDGGRSVAANSRSALTANAAVASCISGCGDPQVASVLSENVSSRGWFVRITF
jgi:hypothetical protein